MTIGHNQFPLWLIFISTLFGIPRLATAGPPFLTDDPEPVEYQHNELDIASLRTRTSSGMVGTMPHFDYNYGATPNLQLHVLLPYQFNYPAGGSLQSGLGDTELGAKYRFLQETNDSPMAAIYPMLITHTGDAEKGLGNGSTQLFLPVWLEKRWGDWQSYGGGGYWINHAIGAQNHWFFGWQLQNNVSEQLALGAEIFYNTAQMTGQGASSGFNVGGSYRINDHGALLFSAGKGLTNVNALNQFLSYIGYQLNW